MAAGRDTPQQQPANGEHYSQAHTVALAQKVVESEVNTNNEGDTKSLSEHAPTCTPTATQSNQARVHQEQV